MKHKIGVKDIQVDSFNDLVRIVSHNAKMTSEIENKFIKDQMKLRKKLNRVSMLSIIFGAVALYKISELELKIDQLKEKVEVDKEE